ncbi:hypothetical protein GCM10010193_33490 [Kitasatospora atroaurantiaca]|uniref:Uncharacterized protein n=1 Tax=Kitasatospora atroaurantiaca TaxID=285545 RepID=A0A561ENL7_9ACTN|nr:hypothetical protein [Kitasatospora atroaurantiaca]TWE17206.1 hypothetical protein FB465_2214 [Kitasatospora atroaurantiaca]
MTNTGRAERRAEQTADHTADHTAQRHSAAALEPQQSGPLSGPRSGPWSVRTTQPRRGRVALEVYEHGELLDVMVASTLSTALLRGARRCIRGGRPAGFAWGRLPADGSLPVVAFTGGWLGRSRQSARVVPLADAFWLAWADEPCGGVLVQHGDEPPTRLRAGRAS